MVKKRLDLFFYSEPLKIINHTEDVYSLELE